MVDNPINARQFIQLIKNNNQQLRTKSQFGEYNLVPSKDFYLDIDTTQVLSMGIIPEEYKNLLVARMNWRMRGNVMEKKDLMILDLIVTNNWERPIYFNNTSKQGVNFNFDKYLIQEGQAYRLLPIANDLENDFVNTELMYDNLMTNFHFRELDDPNVYYNEDYRNFVLNHRSSFNTLADALIREEKETKAGEVIQASLAKMPDISIPYDYTSATTIDLLFQLGELDKAKKIAKIAFSIGMGKNIEYLNRLNKKYNLVDELIALPHPRWVMQYRLKRINEFLEEYKARLGPFLSE